MKENGFEEKVGSELSGKVVIVAVKASKEAPKTALVWALTHIVQPGDCIKLLVIIPSHPSSTCLKGFSRFTSDCSHQKNLSGAFSDQKDDIVQSFSQTLVQLRDIYDSQKIRVKLKVVSGSQHGVVTAEIKRTQSNWVILDKDLKQERKYCMEELQCNVVVMKKSQPKIIRLNLVNAPKMETQEACLPSSEAESLPKCLGSYFEQSIIVKEPIANPKSSPAQESPLTVTEVRTSSISSSDLGTSSLISGTYSTRKEDLGTPTKKTRNLTEFDSNSDSEKPSPSNKTSYFHNWKTDSLTSSNEFSKHVTESVQRANDNNPSNFQCLSGRLSNLALEPGIGIWNHKIDPGLSRNVRETISLSQKAPPGPPPLCSICQHKAPVFGNPPKWFTFTELQFATGGFSQANFLAEGGFGSVHRGVLPDGQIVAVKQYKLASSQGDREFCSEVEVLSCAQHRNVVMLIGFCVESGRRLLVYEYICNGSLHSHLYGRNRDLLEWSARQKIAVGAARGLRYLHEECRVGCIVHRDMRPNNILLTHDFEPLVGDFGLARWQPNGDMGVETRVLGTFGYLAPEYAQSGQITEKADVYSFGVVLLELITGRKAVDVNRPKGQQCLTEWARTLLKKNAAPELVDPCLRNCYSDGEVHRMLQCAFQCIRQDLSRRPRMSQVLRMLEGDVVL